MKKIFCLILTLLILIFSMSVTACAENDDCNLTPSIVLLRAGGGSSGGGSSGGGGGGSGSSSHTHHYGAGRHSSILESVFGFIMMPIILFSSSIVFYIKLTKRSRKAKRLMNQIKKSDSAWKYKDIASNIKESFLAIQCAWTDMDMSKASRYMSDELLDSFQTKLNWMKYRNQKNVLENIQLLKALPVAVHDDSDNSRDHIWFYIKGKMVDYTIDTDTQSVLEGSTRPSTFIEYWQFVRENDSWVLNKILQKNEEDKIQFAE